MATQLETDRGIVRVPTGRWAVDPAHSAVEFRVKHMMISTVRGHFGEFEGTIEAAPEYRDSKVYGTIQAASTDTNEPRRDAHPLGGLLRRRELSDDRVRVDADRARRPR